MNLHALPDEVLREILALTEAKKRLDLRDKVQHDFMAFAHHVYDNFIEGRHHRIIAEKLERVARGELKRLIINMPPRHSKSEFASYLMPAWFLGRNPKLKIIQATHNTELAVRFGRKVRDLINDPRYQEVFPNTLLKEDNKGAGKWGTDKGGEYFAAGVGAAVTGRGADLFIIDDPHSEQDALSETAYDMAYEWYTSGPRQRLQPGGSIILVMCMTGDTPVLMANGVEKHLRDVRPGEFVATYDNGRLSTAKINNWQSSGVDSVFKVQTQSGRILRANERHPFLVEEEGSVRWVKLRDLRPGMELVSLRGASDLLGQKQKTDSVRRVKAENLIAEKTQTLLACRSGIMESGSVLNAQTIIVQARRLRKACAALATRSSFQGKKLLKLPEHIALNIATESLLSSTRQWFSSAAIDAMFAVVSHWPRAPVLTGVASYVSTTAMKLGKFEGFYATTVTLPSGTGRPLKPYTWPLSTSNFTTDSIVSIEPDGAEEVFDVEVDRTENFIANGVVSHNTRWGKKDLTGRLLAAQGSDIFADQWEVVEFPAIMPSGEPLWPEFWDKNALLGIKASLPVAKWSAQWQQQPTGNESAIIRREWWKMWDKDDIPELKYIIQSYDTAFSKKETADYSAITTWGIFQPTPDSPDNIILLDAQRGRWSFPELKEVAYEEHEYWKPDMVLIEAKAAGMPLIDEMRLRGIPAIGFAPGRRAGRGGMDKITRMNLVSPLFEAGVVWAPQDKKFSDEVIEEVASFPYGDHDDFCLAEGTPVLLADGSSRRIEDVRVGDMLATPMGSKPVVDARFTGVKPLWEIRAGGSVLRGTGNHLVATTKGWKRLDTVTMSDTVKLSTTGGGIRWLSRKIQTCFQNAFSLMGRPIAGIQNRLIDILGNTTLGLAAEGSCTKTSGRQNTGPFQLAITSITGTATAKTTTWAISVASRLPSTGPNTERTDGRMALLPEILSTWHSAERGRPNGIRAKKDALGTKQFLRRFWSWLVFASQKNGSNNAKIRSSASAKSVALRFLRRLAVLFSARRRARLEKVVESGVSARVYDLTVADAHCFYASGMLVHNCDSMSLALLRFRQGGFVSLIGDDTNDEPSTFNVREYY